MVFWYTTMLNFQKYCCPFCNFPFQKSNRDLEKSYEQCVENRSNTLTYSIIALIVQFKPPFMQSIL